MSRKLKDSGIPWIGQVPEGWKVERLQWHAVEVNVKNDPVQTTNILSLTNDRGVIPYSEKGNQGNKAKENYSEYKVAFENTIVANSMNILIGSVGLSKFYGCVSPVYYIFKAKENTDIFFLNYLFQMKQFQRELRKYANGILEIRLRVSADDILKRMLAFPPLSEQKAIAEFLDGKCAEIDGLREKIEKQIATLEEYKKSLITESVTRGLDPNAPMKDSGVPWIGQVPEGWKVKRIKHHFDVISGSGFKPNLQGLSEGDYPVCKASDIAKSGRYFSGAANWISKQTAREQGFNVIPKGSILLAKIGEAMKKNNRTISLVDCCADNNCQGLFARETNIEFAYYLFCSMDMSWFDNAGTIPCLNNQKLKDSHIPCPPLSEQKAIADFLDGKCAEIDAETEKCRGMLERLEEYKKALIFECVTGKKEVV